MKTRPADRMKNPYYAQLIFQAEGILSRADQDAKDKGIELSDSQARSAVIKSMKTLKGQNPDIPKTNERESLLAVMIERLVQAPEYLEMEALEPDAPGERIDKIHWINALETVADSIKTRKIDVPGSRVYLNYIHKFIAGAIKEVKHDD